MTLHLASGLWGYLLSCQRFRGYILSSHHPYALCLLPSAACRVLLSLFEIQIDMNCWPVGGVDRGVELGLA